MDVFGDLTVSNNGKGGIKTGLINLSTPFKKFDVSVSNTLLNWITSISNKIFGGIVKKIMGLVLSTFTRQIVIPTVNMVLSNQVTKKTEYVGYPIQQPIFLSLSGFSGCQQQYWRIWHLPLLRHCGTTHDHCS